MIELKESFVTEKSPEEIIELLTKIVHARKGKILSCTENSLKAKFGSKAMVRLFGAGILNITKKQLPLIMDAKIESREKENLLSVYFVDNLGKFGFRDPIAKKAYKKYLAKFLNEIKKAV